MQLIDVLETRSDAVRIYEGADKVRFQCDESGDWWAEIDGASYSITESAFNTLLNLLRIPIKYIQRCSEDPGGMMLAESSVNYWLEKYGDISFLIEYAADQDVLPVVSQVFPGKRLYLPGVQVNDLIFDYLNGEVSVQAFDVEDDVFNAVYLTEEVVTINGEEYKLGVRVLYSDCFTITPRFDGVIYSESGGLLGWPTKGRKFRVASNTIPQVIEQIEEFLDLSLEGLRESLLPSLQKWESDKLIDAEQLIVRLCNDMRYARKVAQELIDNCTETPNHMPHEIVWNIAKYTANLPEDSHIDIGMARDIQIAMSNWIVKESFK